MFVKQWTPVSYAEKIHDICYSYFDSYFFFYKISGRWKTFHVTNMVVLSAEDHKITNEHNV